MFNAIKVFLNSAIAKVLLKVGLAAYEAKNDNEITHEIVDAIEDQFDLDDDDDKKDGDVDA